MINPISVPLLLGLKRILGSDLDQCIGLFLYWGGINTKRGQCIGLGPTWEYEYYLLLKPDLKGWGMRSALVLDNLKDNII